MALAVRVEAVDREPAKICAEFCANCHGTSLTGNAGPNPLDAFWNHGGDAESILRSVRHGWPESGMPPFGQAVSEPEQRALVAFIRQQGEEFAAGRIKLPPPPIEITVKSERATFRLETFVGHLDTPWGVAFLSDGKVLVTERPGRRRLIENGNLLEAPIGGRPEIFLHQDGGLLGVVFNAPGRIARLVPVNDDPRPRCLVRISGARFRGRTWGTGRVRCRRGPCRGCYSECSGTWSCAARLRSGGDRGGHTRATDSPPPRPPRRSRGRRRW